MIAWPTVNGKYVGTVLRESSWDTTPAVIADQTKSGKYIVRGNHVHTPDGFSIVMHMTLPEYRVFDAWWRNTCRRGVYTFAYPKINDNTGILAEYQFEPNSNISIKNISGDNLEVTMSWMEAT